MRHLRWLLVPLIVLPLAALLTTGFGRNPREVSSPLIGNAAPAWELTTLDGATLSSEDLAGRPYVVNSGPAGAGRASASTRSWRPRGRRMARS
jgi:hypothetical protein